MTGWEHLVRYEFVLITHIYKILKESFRVYNYTIPSHSTNKEEILSTQVASIRFRSLFEHKWFASAMKNYLYSYSSAVGKRPWMSEWTIVCLTTPQSHSLSSTFNLTSDINIIFYTDFNNLISFCKCPI